MTSFLRRWHPLEVGNILSRLVPRSPALGVDDGRPAQAAAICKGFIGQRGHGLCSNYCTLSIPSILNRAMRGHRFSTTTPIRPVL